LSNPSNSFHAVNILGYNSSKTALNAVTVAFAKELASSGITVTQRTLIHRDGLQRR
jgi:NAD(P)-dependent dehydrogenase (short-subunit alcohol dehydrogenase family)